MRATPSSKHDPYHPSLLCAHMQDARRVEGTKGKKNWPNTQNFFTFRISVSGLINLPVSKIGPRRRRSTSRPNHNNGRPAAGGRGRESWQKTLVGYSHLETPTGHKHADSGLGLSQAQSRQVPSTISMIAARIEMSSGSSEFLRRL